MVLDFLFEISLTFLLSERLGANFRENHSKGGPLARKRKWGRIEEMSGEGMYVKFCDS